MMLLEKRQNYNITRWTKGGIMLVSETLKAYHEKLKGNQSLSSYKGFSLVHMMAFSICGHKDTQDLTYQDIKAILETLEHNATTKYAAWNGCRRDVHKGQYTQQSRVTRLGQIKSWLFYSKRALQAKVDIDAVLGQFYYDKKYKRPEILPRPAIDPQKVQAVTQELPLKHRIIWGIMTGTATRISETLRIKVKDVQEKYIVIYKTKQGKERKAYFNPDDPTLSDMIKKYIELNGLTPDDYLFPSPYNSDKPIGRATCFSVFQRHGLKQGLKLGNHDGKRVCVNDLTRKGIDLYRMRQFTDTTIQTLQRHYIGRFSDQEMQEVARA